MSQLVPCPPDPSDQHEHDGEDEARRGRASEDRRRKEERDLRRLIIAEMLLAHIPYRTIASQLGLSKTQIHREVTKIRAQWRDRASVAYQSHVAEELGKLDALERAVLGKAFHGDEGLADLGAVDRALRIAERRARLLGLDQPVKVSATVELPDLEAKKERGRALLDELARKREQRAAEQ
jgi:hypothetical protein